MTRARELAELGSVYDNGALSNRNVVINGSLDVSQRGTSFTNIGSAGTYDDTYTMDRFLISQGVSAGRCTVTQDTDRPAGFSKSLKIATTTADTSIAAGEYHRLQTKFEGQDLKRFAKGTASAKEFTLSFYCKANAAATYVVELNDTDNTRSVSKTFSVTTDWTRVIITFPADTASGTGFNNDNNLSMEVNWWFHAGSTYSSGTLATTWAGTVPANRAVGIDSIFDSTARTFFITGVQLEVGTEATPFEHRSVGQELALCQRYYFQLNGDSSDRIGVGGYAVGASEARMDVAFPCAMRAAPTISGTGTAQFDAHTDSADFNVSDMVIDEAPTGIISGIGIQIASSSMVAGQSGGFRFRSTGTLSFASEL